RIPGRAPGQARIRGSGRARPVLRTAFEPRTARHAYATVLGAHLDLDVAAPPRDRDVIATVATLAQIGGRLPLALAQRRTVDAVEHHPRDLVGVGGERRGVEPHHLHERPD